MATIAVTGSTGRLGGRVARRLAAAGTSQRLLVRDLARAPALDGAEAELGDFADAGTVEQSLAGIETVLMVSAAETRTGSDSTAPSSMPRLAPAWPI